MRWTPRVWWGWFLVPLVWPALVIAHMVGLGYRILSAAFDELRP